VSNNSPWRGLIKVGDIVILANHKNINNVNDLNKVFLEAINDKKNNIALLINRNGNNIFLALSLKLNNAE
jgi:hypothetical protein